MTVALHKLSFAEYRAYSDHSDCRYELVEGELTPMSVGTGLHGAITEWLTDCFKAEIRRQQLPWTAKDMRIGVQSPRGGRWDTSRIPDVTVLTQSQWETLAQREAIITLDQPPPLLVAEVVGESTRTTNYRGKRSEYAVLGIPEYWLVDSAEEKVMICSLVDGFYDEATFTNGAVLVSPTFPALNLKAEEVLRVKGEI
ncbi:MAG: Uma2 family endonuclease [Cyanobacteria bacterium RI_101]|nr:Uma2 family endonuclease [Cyanobacteria bacterium RI_101]